MTNLAKACRSRRQFIPGNQIRDRRDCDAQSWAAKSLPRVLSKHDSNSAVLLLVALFFSPLIAMIGAYPPITAPALTIVGAMMMQNVAKIDWKDYTESIPAFLIIVGIPFSYSIADGLALGFISYAVVKGFSGRAREVSWLTYLLAIVLVVYFILCEAE